MVHSQRALKNAVAGKTYMMFLEIFQFRILDIFQTKRATPKDELLGSLVNCAQVN